MRYELADYEWTAIKPMLPNKPRGVLRVNDRRVLNGIFWILRRISHPVAECAAVDSRCNCNMPAKPRACIAGDGRSPQ
jgi:hypothetical protein